MKIDDGGEQGNVEDRRGMSRGTVMGGGIAVIVIGLVASYLGINPAILQQFLGGAGGQQRGPADPPKDGYKEFSAKVLGNMNTIWRDQFRKNGLGEYDPPKMVLFSAAVDTKGCGVNIPAGVGPFYCPADMHVYLDPTFFTELQKLGGSKAEFSQAYVIAHEVGHHVQNLLGYNDQVERFKRGEGENSGIRLELQADYLAGVWAHHATRQSLIRIDPTEVEDALRTAKSIGDDLLTKGRVSPEKFNHGTSKQRYYFFKRGFETGDASKSYLDRFMSPSVEPLKMGPNTGF
jgi:predicted metalloprotease